MDDDLFRSALENFSFEVACGGAIRRLHDLGMTPEQIHDRLDYPVTVKKICDYIKQYEEKKTKQLNGDQL